MAKKYKEFWSPWNLVEAETGMTGRREFYEDPDGTITLPAVNDAWSAEYPNLRCTTRTRSKYAPNRSDRTKWVEKVVCDYTVGDQPQFSRNTEDRKFDASIEMETTPNLQDDAAMKWNADNAPVDDCTVIHNVTGTFTRIVTFGSDASKKKWVQTVLRKQLGTINNKEFEDFAEGQVLWESISGGTQYDSLGNRTWVFECHFAFKILRGGIVGGNGLAFDVANAEIEKDDWLYQWRRYSTGANIGRWDKIVTGATKIPVKFAKTDFSLIFK